MAPVELLYVANPMCSWCWGFAPVVRHVEAAYRDRVTLTVALGALGDSARTMRERDKAFVRRHWEHVRDLTGQPFDFAFFERHGFDYDSEPACRAVAAVRTAAPDRAMAYLHRIQEAFYARGRDVREPGELAGEASSLGIDPAGVEAALASPDLAVAVREEFRQTAALGVTGYPTLLGLAAGRAEVVSLGCRPLADVVAGLDRMLAATPCA